MTQWNASKRFQGHSDIELSDEGRAQARALFGALLSESYDAVYASDLSRALETARIALGGRGPSIRPDARLREFDFGAWEGLRWDEITERWPELRDRGSTAAKLYRPEGGESFEEVTARVSAFFDDLRKSDANRVLVVTHAGVLHATLASFGEALVDHPSDPMSLSFAQASISRIAMEPGRARLITLNDVSHLYPAG